MAHGFTHNAYVDCEPLVSVGARGGTTKICCCGVVACACVLCCNVAFVCAFEYVYLHVLPLLSQMQREQVLRQAIRAGVAQVRWAVILE